MNIVITLTPDESLLPKGPEQPRFAILKIIGGILLTLAGIALAYAYTTLTLEVKGTDIITASCSGLAWPALIVVLGILCISLGVQEQSYYKSNTKARKEAIKNLIPGSVWSLGKEEGDYKIALLKTSKKGPFGLTFSQEETFEDSYYLALYFSEEESENIPKFSKINENI